MHQPGGKSLFNLKTGVAIWNPSAKKEHNLLIGTKAILDVKRGSVDKLIVIINCVSEWKDMAENTEVENMESKNKAGQC